MDESHVAAPLIKLEADARRGLVRTGDHLLRHEGVVAGVDERVGTRMLARNP